jgi:hypothetical protein
VPEIIDPVFAKTSPKRSFSMTENERFGLVFANTGSINSGTAVMSKDSGTCIEHDVQWSPLSKNGKFDLLSIKTWCWQKLA